MSDVAAIVLTVGEQTTGRALASLRAQTLPVDEVVIVDGVRPFHRAFNSGADRVSAPFFVQVDADMVLDPDCVEALRAQMSPTTGIAVGALRDPLMGTIAGVKMFRSSCLEGLRLRDTIGPEVDLYRTLGRLGWLTTYLTGHGLRPMRGPTLGAHLPEYTLDYAFGTYYMLGSMYAHSPDGRGLRWRFTGLRRAAHPMAPVARMAMAHGFLRAETRDIGKPRPRTADAAFLRRLVVRAPHTRVAPRTIRRLMALAIEPLFEAFRELGASLRAASPAALLGCMRVLGQTDEPRSHLAELALGSGALATPAQGGIPVAFERLAATWATEQALERAA
jgi:hypothetical protein